MLVGRPTDLRGVVRSTEDQLRSAIIPRANVRNVRLVLHQNLCAPEIAQFQHSGLRIQEEILRLDVAVADALRMDVCKGAEELVDVEFHFEYRHRGLELVEMARGTVDGLGHEFEHQVQVYFIFLRCDQRCLYSHEVVKFANPITVAVVESLQLHYVGVSHDSHDLQFSVLRGVRIRCG